METDKKENIEKNILINIEHVLLKYKIIGRDYLYLLNKYGNHTMTEKHWVDLLTKNKYI